MRLLLALALWLPLTASAGLPYEQRWTLRNSAALARTADLEMLTFDPNTYNLAQKRVFPLEWAGGQEHSLRFDGGLGGQEGLRLDWNLLATLGLGGVPTGPFGPQAQPLGRSAVLQHRFMDHGDQRLDAEVDQAALRWQGDLLSVALGRQSVNLGENFFFSPLDLFLPFFAQQSYREFRPGVDALRLGLSPSRFSLIELIAVAGYRPIDVGVNTAEHPLLWEGPQGQASLLGRAQAGGDAWSLSVMGGRSRHEALGGGALQVELLGASWTFEGLEAVDLLQNAGRSEITLGVTRQWNSWLGSRLEQNFANRYHEIVPQRLIRGGASLSIQASPLLSLAPSYFWYPSDHNAFASLVATLSLSDDSVLELGLNAPLLFPGPGSPYASAVEFAPTSFSLEIRSAL
jgi:hypothetical protein